MDRAAGTLLKMKPHGLKFVKIFVDSQSAIQALGNPIISSKAVLAATKKLNLLADIAKSVTVTWIPAHKGHEGNEKADVLAKRGAADEGGNHKLTVGKPGSKIRTEIRKAVYDKWKTEWQNSKEANHTKSFYKQPCWNKAKYVYKLARLELGRFVRIVTGHNNLNFFQHKLGYTDKVTCRMCKQGQETLMHLMYECPALTLRSMEVFQGEFPDEDMLWSVRKLLEFSYTPCVNEAYEDNKEDSATGAGRAEDVGDLSRGWLSEEDD